VRWMGGNVTPDFLLLVDSREMALRRSFATLSGIVPALWFWSVLAKIWNQIESKKVSLRLTSAQSTKGTQLC